MRSPSSFVSAKHNFEFDEPIELFINYVEIDNQVQFYYDFALTNKRLNYFIARCCTHTHKPYTPYRMEAM